MYQEGAGSVRFVSVPDFSKVHRFGSVRFGSDNSVSRFDTVRPALFGRVVARSGSVRFGSASGSGRIQNQTVRLGPVRFGSASGSGRFWPVPELNGSVRFGSADEVGFLIPSCRLWTCI